MAARQRLASFAEGDGPFNLPRGAVRLAASPAVSQYRGAGGDHPGHLRRLADPHQGNLPLDLPSAGEWRMGVMEIEQLYFGGSPNGQIQAVLADAA
jgi:hypothetical protein